jgi:hypothetical protein
MPAKKGEQKFRYGLKASYIADVLITAFEGGIGYWAQIHSYQKPPNGTPFPFKMSLVPSGENYMPSYAWLPLVKGGAVILTDDSGEEAFEPVTLDLKAIKRGLDLMHTVAGGFHLKNLLSENYDAETADVFVQLAVFGEVIFG